MRMAARTTIVLTCMLALAACGPRYAVYDGGLGRTHAETLQSVNALAPSEAGASFSTDYAPPTENLSFAGPTNRVKTEVPSGLPEHGLMSVRTSDGVRSYRLLGNTELRSSPANAEGRTASRPARLMAGTDVAESLAGTGRGAQIETVDRAGARVTSAGAASDTASRNVRLATASAAAAEATRPANSLGLLESDATLEPTQNEALLTTQTRRTVGTYRTNKAVEGRGSSTNALAATGADTAQEMAEPVSGLGVAKSYKAAGIETVERPADYRLTRAVESRTGTLAPALMAESDSAQLLAGSDTVLGVGNARYILAMRGMEGVVVYKRVTASVVLSEPEAIESITGGGAPQATSTSKNALATDVSNAAQEASKSNAAIRTSTRETVGQRGVSRNVRLNEWTGAPQSFTSVAPPSLYVFKEARLFKEGGIDRLLDAGVLKDRPRGEVVIGYRINVYNAGNAAAKDVKVLDRLDDGLALLVNSMATNSETATAKYFLETRGIEVDLPRLEPGGYLVVEFYVEPVSVP